MTRNDGDWIGGGEGKIPMSDQAAEENKNVGQGEDFSGSDISLSTRMQRLADAKERAADHLQHEAAKLQHDAAGLRQLARILPPHLPEFASMALRRMLDRS